MRAHKAMPWPPVQNFRQFALWIVSPPKTTGSFELELDKVRMGNLAIGLC